MKANQKFRGSEEAVSPVIAVILMVAITVVLSATVYVWVSGFGGNKNQPSRAITLIGDGPLTSAGMKTFTVSAADSSLYYRDLTFTLDGATLELETGDCTPDVEAPTAGAEISVCRGPDVKDGDALIKAGDTLRLLGDAGDVLRILDTQANSVLYTVTIG